MREKWWAVAKKIVNNQAEAKRLGNARLQMAHVIAIHLEDQYNKGKLDAVQAIIDAHEQTCIGTIVGKKENDMNRLRGVTIGSVWRAVAEDKS